MKSLQAEPFTLEIAQEKKELETVLESGIFAVSSNAAKLLRFVCERYFNNAADTITEHDVAIHALASRSDFDPQTDSIVRVEAHRVRKRLQEYYETEGAFHPVKIVLSRGHYAPRFIHADTVLNRVADEPSTSLDVEVAPVAPPNGLHPVRPLLRGRWRLAWAAAAIIAAGLATGFPWMRSFRDKQLAARPVEPAAGVGSDTVRILAGLASGAYMDRSGTRWSADGYFTGGTATAVRYYSLAGADDPAIYQHARTGENFSYDIPLRPGRYEMRLMFAESAEVVILGAVGEGSRNFHVTANGVQILPPIGGRHMRQLDVVADAGGSNTADVKVFKDITPAADGKLHLRFIGRNQAALVNAIEIVPGLNGKMRPLRWRANETPYTDHAGNLWLSDRYFRGGRLSRFHAVVSRTADPSLYEEERFGAFTYSIPVVVGGSYTVRMYFAENYFGGWAAPASPPRVFTVYANHTLLLHDFDISREAGGAVAALTKTFRGIKPNPFDKIVLSFEPSTEFAIVNAIAVEDEAK
ncbi:MAG: malectin domain-containing carbohydrate-binding protein [Bryobacteraceae bacterium]